MFSHRLLIFGILITASTSAYAGDTLEEFAKKCDQAIGVTVPDFSSDKGTKVPTTHFSNDRCDRPNVLNGKCDPESRFQVLVDNATAYVVAHSRKQGNGPGEYGDIAVIQHNKVNGATCFYQGALHLSHNGDVKAPSKGVGNPAFWMTPTAIATSSFPCVECHDNGPIIRSPYLAQVKGADGKLLLPGAGDPFFNRDQPYSFIGSDFASWKTYKVEVTGNICTTCHRMGVSNQGGGGTARDLGIRATAQSQQSKNPHSADSPIWMKPNQIVFTEDSAKAAKEIRDCAVRINEDPLPNSATCRIIQYTGATGECIFQDNVSWVVDQSCKITRTRTARNVSVTNGAVLTIENNAVLMLDMRQFRIHVAPDSRIIVVPGGRIQSMPE